LGAEIGLSGRFHQTLDRNTLGFEAADETPISRRLVAFIVVDGAEVEM